MIWIGIVAFVLTSIPVVLAVAIIMGQEKRQKDAVRRARGY